jgi:tRNA pseudouridine-54 N-methylase
LVEALEECGTREVVDHDSAIKALKKELKIVEAEKKWLTEEVAGLRVSRINFEDLKEKVESLSKALEVTKVAE